MEKQPTNERLLKLALVGSIGLIALGIGAYKETDIKLRGVLDDSRNR